MLPQEAGKKIQKATIINSIMVPMLKMNTLTVTGLMQKAIGPISTKLHGSITLRAGGTVTQMAGLQKTNGSE